MKACPVCDERYSQADFNEAFSKVKWSVACHFLSLCKWCSNILVMKYTYREIAYQKKLQEK